MSTTLEQRPATSTHPTRQQLDELDVLLQRMMKLPVQPGEEPVGPRQTTSSGSAPAPMPKKQAPMEVVEPPSRPTTEFGTPDDLVRLAASWQPSAQTWGPLADTLKQSSKRTVESSGRSAALTPAEEAFRDFDGMSAGMNPIARQDRVAPNYEFETPPVVAPVIEKPSRSATPEANSNAFAEIRPAPAPKVTLAVPTVEPPPAMYLWPLIAFNVVFDTLLFLVWPLRSWLRGPVGRNLLAGVGILGMCCAIVLVARDWFGWTW